MAYKIKKSIRYRNPKTGRFQKRKTKTSIVESTETMIDTSKKGIIRQKETIKEKVIKKIETSTINALEGDERGKISEMLDTTDIRTGRVLKGAKKLIITIKGKDFQNKEQRIKGIFDVKGEKFLADLMTGRIAALLHEKGFRPQYSLEIVDWSTAKTSKSFSKKKKQLKNMTIIIEVQK